MLVDIYQDTLSVVI